MHVAQQDVLHHRLAAALPHLRPPALLLQRLAEVVGTEVTVLIAGDLQPLGFGAYQGELCLVTPTRVVLVTATGRPAADGGFGVEQWERRVAPLPACPPVRLRPRSPEPEPEPAA